MATGRIILPALAWVPLDGSTGNHGPALDFVQSVAAAPSPRYARWAFDKDVDEHLCVVFRLPDDFVSGPVVKVDWYCITDTGDCVWGCRLAAQSEGDMQGVINIDCDAAVTTVQDATRSYLGQFALDLSAHNDNLAAGDIVMLVLFRDADNAADTVNYDAYFLGGVFEYTTA